jgi:hypothetical protein
MAHHYHPLENCLARIFFGYKGRQNDPCGTGVVLHGGRVLTCAHVVKTALRLPPETLEKPEQTITLDFPLSASRQRFTANVIFWDIENDIAGLELVESLPIEIEPTQLYATGELWGHRIQAFGFPDNYPAGTWADSILRGPNAYGWIEIVDSQTTGYYVQQGFSGGPVWDEHLQHCIGIIVAADRNAILRASYLIPAHKIAEKWKDLPVESVHRKHRSTTKEVPPLLAYRVNRKAQEDCLTEIYACYDPQAPLPVVAIIHGDDKQAHDMFLMRLANEFIPKLLGMDLSNTPITRIQLPWPTHIQKIDHLSIKLAKGMSEQVLHASNASCEEVQSTLAAYNSPVIVEMHLLTDDWMKHKKGILEANLEFWNRWPALAPRQNLFVFLCLTHKTPASNWAKRLLYNFHKKQIFTQITYCAFHHYDRVIGGVLPELTNISRTETEDWARQEAYEYLGGDLTALMSEIRTLYESLEQIPMETLAQNLKEILVSGSDG